MAANEESDLGGITGGQPTGAPDFPASASGALSGSSNSISSATGLLLGYGSLSGASISVSSATGAFTNTGALSGSSDSVSSATGNLLGHEWLFNWRGINATPKGQKGISLGVSYVPTFRSPLGPEDTDDFQFDFSSKLAGATISQLVEIVVSPSSGLTISDSAIISGKAGSNSAIGFTASVGTPQSPGLYKANYTVSVSIVTSDGRDLTRSAIMLVNLR